VKLPFSKALPIRKWRICALCLGTTLPQKEAKPTAEIGRSKAGSQELFKATHNNFFVFYLNDGTKPYTYDAPDPQCAGHILCRPWMGTGVCLEGSPGDSGPDRPASVAPDIHAEFGIGRIRWATPCWTMKIVQTGSH
jgi:hypothetical protein